jgi:hypothetical protein
MCRFHWFSQIDQNGYEECDSEDNQSLPKVLIAITIIKQKADFAMEDIYNIFEIMQKTKHILSNIVIIHQNVKENANIAIKRINRLSEHLKTYERIISQIDLKLDSNKEFKDFSKQVQDIHEMNDEFNEFWNKRDLFINQSYNEFEEKLKNVIEFKKLSEEIMLRRDYIKMPEMEIMCKNEYKYSKDLDQTCNHLCKESGDQCSHICSKVSILENNFNQILKDSLELMESAKKAKNKI